MSERKKRHATRALVARLEIRREGAYCAAYVTEGGESEELCVGSISAAAVDKVPVRGASFGTLMRELVQDGIEALTGMWPVADTVARPDGSSSTTFWSAL